MNRLHLAPAKARGGKIKHDTGTEAHVLLTVVASIRQVSLHIIHLRGPQCEELGQGEFVRSACGKGKGRCGVDCVGAAPEVGIKTADRTKQRLCKDALPSGENDPITRTCKERDRAETTQGTWHTARMLPGHFDVHRETATKRQIYIHASAKQHKAAAGTRRRVRLRGRDAQTKWQCGAARADRA